MREIKFRAWDEIEEKYNNDTDILMTLNGDYCVDKGWVRLFPKLTLEQYIGLKDKNGKEIYEGDIVKCYSQDTYPAGRVLYSEEWCAYEIVSYDPEDCRVYNLESFSPTVNKYLEVIGNIHENPELLGDEQ